MILSIKLSLEVAWKIHKNSNYSSFIFVLYTHIICIYDYESNDWREDILTQRTAHDWHGKNTTQTKQSNNWTISHMRYDASTKIWYSNLVLRWALLSERCNWHFCRMKDTHKCVNRNVIPNGGKLVHFDVEEKFHWNLVKK